MDEGGIPQLPVMGEFHYSRMHLTIGKMPY